MTKLKTVALSMLVLLFAPALALAQAGTTTTSTSSLEGLLRTAVESAGSGAWGLFAGALVMLAVQLANRFGLLRAIPKSAKKWVALALATLGAVGTGLLASAPWTDILVTAVTTALAAVGSWEFVKNALKGD